MMPFTKGLAKYTALMSAVAMLMGSQSLVAEAEGAQRDGLVDTMILVNEAAGNSWWKFRTSQATWNNAVYHMGNMALYRMLLDANETAKANEYLERSRKWAVTNDWGIGPERRPDRFADRVAAGQAYIELAEAGVPGADLGPIMEAVAPRDPEPELTEDGLGAMSLWWVDSLFMAGPIFSKFCDSKGDVDFCERLDAMYAYTKSTLYNSNTGLWYARPGKEEIDEYWLRGNGWRSPRWRAI